MKNNHAFSDSSNTESFSVHTSTKDSSQQGGTFRIKKVKLLVLPENEQTGTTKINQSGRKDLLQFDEYRKELYRKKTPYVIKSLPTLQQKTKESLQKEAFQYKPVKQDEAYTVKRVNLVLPPEKVNEETETSYHPRCKNLREPVQVPRTSYRKTPYTIITPHSIPKTKDTITPHSIPKTKDGLQNQFTPRCNLSRFEKARMFHEMSRVETSFSKGKPNNVTPILTNYAGHLRPQFKAMTPHWGKSVTQWDIDKACGCSRYKRAEEYARNRELIYPLPNYYEEPSDPFLQEDECGVVTTDYGRKRPLPGCGGWLHCRVRRGKWTTRKLTHGSAARKETILSSLKRKKRLSDRRKESMENDRVRELFQAFLLAKKPIIWVFGRPIKSVSLLRRKYCTQLAQKLQFEYISMDDEIAIWAMIGQIAINAGDTEFQNLPPVIRAAVPLSLKLTSDPTFSLTRHETFLLLKYALVSKYPCNGFILDGFPWDNTDADDFERKFYPVAAGIYWLTSEWTNNKHKMPTVIPPLFFRRDVKYNELEVEDACSNYGIKTMKIVHCEDLDEILSLAINDVVDEYLVNYDDIVQGNFESLLDDSLELKTFGQTVGYGVDIDRYVKKIKQERARLRTQQKEREKFMYRNLGVTPSMMQKVMGDDGSKSKFVEDNRDRRRQDEHTNPKHHRKHRSHKHGHDQHRNRNDKHHHHSHSHSKRHGAEEDESPPHHHSHRHRHHYHPSASRSAHAAIDERPNYPRRSYSEKAFPKQFDNITGAGVKELKTKSGAVRSILIEEDEYSSDSDSGDDVSEIPKSVVKDNNFWGYTSTRHRNKQPEIKLPRIYPATIARNEKLKEKLAEESNQAGIIQIVQNSTAHSHHIPDPYNVVPYHNIEQGTPTVLWRKGSKVAIPNQAVPYTTEPTHGLRTLFSPDMAKLVSKNQSQVQQIKVDQLTSKAARVEYEIYQDDYRLPKYRFFKQYKEHVPEDYVKETANWVPCANCFDSRDQAAKYDLAGKLDALDQVKTDRENKKKEHISKYGKGSLFNRIFSCLCGEDNEAGHRLPGWEPAKIEEDDEDLNHFMDAPDYKEKRKKY